MDSDYSKQPSRHPSSTQHRKYRSITSASNHAEVNSASILKKRERNGSKGQHHKPNNVINNMFESKESLTLDDEDDDKAYQTPNNFLVNVAETNTNNISSSNVGRGKQREVGKVKPIRIIPPTSSIEQDNVKLKSTSAWEESKDDNHKNVEGVFLRGQNNLANHIDDKDYEIQEKMIINKSDFPSKKYYDQNMSSSADVDETGKGESGKSMIFDRKEIPRKTDPNANDRPNYLDNNERRRDSSGELARLRHEIQILNASHEGNGDIDMIKSQMSATSTMLTNNYSMSASRVSSSASSSERVKVIVRCRPMSRREVEQGHQCVVTVNRESGEIEVKRPQSTTPSTHSLYSNSGSVPEVKIFSFDSVYDLRISQKQLYDDAFRPLVNSVLEGYNGTIFAYGQTGTGKTFTMEGVRDDDDQHGVIPNAFKHIFSHVVENPNKQYLIRASYLEIYQEEIRDLLSKDRRQHRELKESPTSGVYVKELSTYLCSNFSEINELMTRGNKNRAVGATNMNEHSSRSHAIFQITIEVSEEWPDGQNHFKVGKLNLVDLAGSERQGKTGAVGERLKEATKINLSLSALGNVIAALVDGKSTHIPYRDSKLTRLLQDSLGGNSHTIMVATVGPASFNWEETITTLRYASRAKKIKNKPKVNEDPKDAMLRQYQEEIARLRAELDKKKEKQAEMLQRSQQEQQQSSSSGRLHTGRNRSSRAATASSTASDTSSSASDQLRQIEEQRMKELASLLAPYGVDPSSDPQDIMSQLDDRRRELLNDGKTLKEEKDKLLRQLDETQSLVRNTAEECKKLSEKIQWLESKVLTGGKSLVDHTNEQQKLIQAKQQELAEQTERYEEMRRKLQENELTTTELRSNTESLEAELHTKTKKLKKLSQKLYFTKEELGTVNDEHVNTMKELENVLMELKKEFSLKHMIIDNFIPYPSRKMIESRIVWDKQMEEYKLAPMNSSSVLQRPPMTRMTKTPLYSLSETGTVHMVDNVHYLDENILQLHPELPKRKTKDYVPPSRDPYITSLIKRAVEDAEKEVTLDCPNINKKRNKTAKIPQKNSDYFKMGNNLLCRRVKSAKPVTRGGPGLQQVQFRDFVVVSNFHKHFSPANYGHNPSVLRGGGSLDY